MGSNLDRFKFDMEEARDYSGEKKLKIGIIGTGWIAESHVESYKRCPDVELWPRPIWFPVRQRPSVKNLD